MKIAHIIPTYNEKDNIKNMLDVLYDISRKHSKWRNIVVIVDDRSPDGTGRIVKNYPRDKLEIHLLSKKKEGLGKALIMGYEYAVNKLKADVVIPNDADFQWDPRDFPKLVNKIEEGYDVVVASRHVIGGEVIGWNWFRKLNHDVSNSLLAWWLSGVHEVRDHAGNFKAIKVKGILDKVPLEKMRNAGFSFQLHILYELSKAGAKFSEVPVIFRERKFGKSKIGFNRYYLRDIVEYIKSSLLIRFERSARFFKYAATGVAGLAVQTLVSNILVASNLMPALAVSLGAECAIISNFLLNNFWTFRSHVIKGFREIGKKFLQFNLASVGAIFIQGVVVYIATLIFGEKIWFPAMIFAIIFLVIPYSYFVYNRFIWRTHRK